MTEPVPAVPAGQPQSPHAQATEAATGHLRDALSALQGTYGHPHHAGRLENIGQQITNLISILEPMPAFEASRADRAGHLVAKYRDGKFIPHDHPDSDRELLAQELERGA